MTAEKLKAILQKWDEDAEEAIEQDGVGISAEGIVISHPDIENRAGLALVGMSVADALAELEEPDDGQKELYFRGRVDSAEKLWYNDRHGTNTFKRYEIQRAIRGIARF